MDVVYDSKIARWLTDEWDQTLDLDQSNTLKLAKHSVSVEQVESVLDGSFVLGGQIIRPVGIDWSEERFVLYGQTEDGRKLTIVWTIRGTKMRPISCRSMRPNENKIYDSRIK